MSNEKDNTGDWNTGYWNTGDRNTGNRNTGNRNTGNWNPGDWNTGHWNTGNCNTGYFCENDGPVLFFDKHSNLTREAANVLIPHPELPVGAKWVELAEMTDKEKAENPSAQYVGGYLKKYTMPLRESFPIWWSGASEEERKQFTRLPNFDADKIERMFGVRVNEQPVPREIVVDGVTYVRKD